MVRNRKPSAEYSVIIPQHGCWEKTVSCCSSLLRHHACALELLVVDDGSNEWDRARSRRYLRDMAWCIEQPRSGVTAAWNRGLSLASAPVRVLLNNDVETLASWLPELGRILHAEPRALVGAETGLTTLVAHGGILYVLAPSLGLELSTPMLANATPMRFDRAGRGPNPTAVDGTPARATVARARFMGRESLVEYRMDEGGEILKATVPGVFLPKPGTVMWLMIRRDRCFVFPRRA